jgi:hypothetical protein
VDVVEVLRGTAAGPLLVAAGAAGAVAAVATILTVSAWWMAPRAASGRRTSRWLLEVAFAASTLELAFLLLDGASLRGRWPAVVLVRLLVLVGLAVLPETRRRPSLDGGEVSTDRSPAAGAGTTDPGARLLAITLSATLLTTSALGAPTATGALPAGARGMAAATGLVLLLLAATTGVLRLSASRGPAVALAGPLGLLVLVATPVAITVAPDRVPPHQQAQLAVDELTLDVTVAPVRAGTNELHVYAFGPDGRPSPVREVTVEVLGAPTGRHQLFEVSPDHHLSYVLELPASGAWDLRIELRDPDGVPRVVTWSLEAPR